MTYTDKKNYLICCYCNKQKMKHWSGKKLKDGSKIYIDENKKRWAGKRCPDCEKKRIKNALKFNPQEKKTAIDLLKEKNYRIISSQIPLKVEKNQIIYNVEILQAYFDSGNIVLNHNSPDSKDRTIYILLFNSARLFEGNQFQSLMNSQQIKNISVIKQNRKNLTTTYEQI